MKFMVKDVEVGGDQLFLIAGPCVIESEDHALKMAECIAGVAKALKIPYIFKASFDKANRTSLKSFRGPGLRDGLKVLRKVAQTVNIPVLTDIHGPEQASEAAEVCDVLQIPAFLCRQTDLLVAAAKTGRAINIKKGQFVSPWDMRHAVQKVKESDNERVFLTERGASFGYNNLVVDMRSLAIMRDFAPVVFDATHSVQLPSAGADSRDHKAGVSPAGPQASSPAAVQSGGQPQFIPVLSRAAVAAGLDGIFMEVHDDPPQALSDGANALDLRNLRTLLSDLLAIRKAVTHPAPSVDLRD